MHAVYICVNGVIKHTTKFACVRVCRDAVQRISRAVCPVHSCACLCPGYIYESECVGDKRHMAKIICKTLKTTADPTPWSPVPFPAARRVPSVGEIHAKSVLHHFSTAETFI